MDSIRIKVKEGVILHPNHWSAGTAKILQAMVSVWPIPELVITRGCENAPGSKPNSKHFHGKAFDFRCRALPASVDRDALLRVAMGTLGPDYYGYYKLEPDAEWMNVQWNG